MYSPIIRYLEAELKGFYLVGEKLKLHTYYKIGGPADLFVFPNTEAKLIELIAMCNDFKKPFYVIGEGANLLVSDSGYKGIILDLREMSTFVNLLDSNTIEVGSATLLKDVIFHCECNGLSGFEYLSGIPGTIGGALSMNAGTSDWQISQNLLWVEIIDNHLNKLVLEKEDIDFGYRSSPQLTNCIITKARFRVNKTTSDILKKHRISQLMRRASKQPIEFASCGSVFKRPKGFFVGEMVANLNLKGHIFGDAMISEKHGGFIVNLGNAKSEDVLHLIELVEYQVREKFNVDLEREVVLLGFN